MHLQIFQHDFSPHFFSVNLKVPKGRTENKGESEGEKDR